MRKVLALLLWLHCSSLFATHVVLINPTNDQETFWRLITDLTIDAADDLGVKLTVFYADSNRIVQSDLVQQITQSANKPDYVIFMPYGGSIIKSFDALEKAKIPFVTLERVYNRAQFPDLGLPQQHYKYWLGEIYHDNHSAGQLLTKALIDLAKKNYPANAPLHAIGIGGDFYTESLERMKGFISVINQHQNITLNHTVPANWGRNEANAKFSQLQERYRNINLVFAASDKMALGVLDSLNKFNLTANQDIFIGGIDWLPEAILAIKQNKLTASVGGHFLQGVWALIKIYDHEHGKSPFIIGDTKAYINLELIDQNNVDKYIKLTKPFDLQKTNFAEFSLTHKANKKPEIGYQLNAKTFVEKLVVHDNVDYNKH